MPVSVLRDWRRYWSQWHGSAVVVGLIGLSACAWWYHATTIGMGQDRTFYLMFELFWIGVGASSNSRSGNLFLPQMISDISRTVVRMSAFRVYEDGSHHPAKSIMTGFLWNASGDTFLITNWHNVTGVRPDTLAPMGSFVPNTITITFYVCKGKRDDQDEIAARTRVLDLFGESGQPIWIEHPKRNAVDLVAIKLNEELFIAGQPYCLNEVDFESRWLPGVGSECFVVGYPEGLVGPLNSPIWKRASIASEPNHPVEHEPEILIDTLGNEGLSGSPVIAQSSGVFVPDGGSQLTTDAGIGTWRNFLGVYAGRTSADGVGFQLGRVWKAHLVEEILQSGVTGHHPLM